MVLLKRSHFSLYYCVFFSTVRKKLVGRLNSYLLKHTKKYMTPIHALNFENMSTCMYMQDMLKSRCKFVMLLGKYAQQKQVGWEVIFPCSEASGGFNCVSKVLLKSQCKKYGIWKGKINNTLARCAFFYQHCFTKIIET